VADPLARLDVLLSDRAGERYSEASVDSAILSELEEIRLADQVVVLSDGERLVSAEERTSAIQSVQLTLRAFRDAKVIGLQTQIQVVTTKIDLFIDDTDAAETKRRIALAHERLKADLEGRVMRLTFWDIAARDPSDRLPIAHGVEELFGSWLEPRESAPVEFRRNTQLTTQFDLVRLKTPLDHDP
jgi:hypothetical protein